MNNYLISLVEIILLSTIAYFTSKNIFIFTHDDSLVNLNYIFWGVVITLSILINFNLYLYFGTVFVLGVAFLAIYIHKTVRVITFVDKSYTLFFWMLFATLFIPLIIILISKHFLYSAFASEAPQGNIGHVGDVGNRGNNYFIESVGDRAYVIIINELETYFREILDKNEIDYDANEPQFNNFYLKENIKRICNSTEFIDKLWNKSKTSREGEQSCKFFEHNDQRKRFCSDPSISTPTTTKYCINDNDCRISNAENIQMENTNLSDNLKLNPNDTNDLYMLVIRIKYWIRLILENNCEQDKQLRTKLKIQDIYKLSETKLGFIDNFQAFQETSNNDIDVENYFKGYSINYLRMNNLLGRKFIQSNFQNHKYWAKNNIKTINRNPFDIINNDPIWKYGLRPEANDECKINNNVISQGLGNFNKNIINNHAATPSNL